MSQFAGSHYSKDSIRDDSRNGALFMQELEAATDRVWYDFRHCARRTLDILKDEPELDGGIVKTAIETGYSLANADESYDDRVNILDLYYLASPRESSYRALCYEFGEVRSRTISALRTNPKIPVKKLVERAVTQIRLRGEGAQAQQTYDELKFRSTTSVGPSFWHSGARDLLRYAPKLLPADVVNMTHGDIAQIVTEARQLLEGQGQERVPVRSRRQVTDTIYFAQRTVLNAVFFANQPV